jgi:DNA-directed RNA polymerase specialized sigma24 family protein
MGDGPSEDEPVGAGTGDNDDFLEWLKGVPDPRERYRQATDKLETYQRAVEELSSLRAAAAAAAYESAGSVRELASELGVSPTRAHQLIKEARPGPSRKKPAKRRSSDRQKRGEE